jgi:hypothetical protein
VLTIGCDSKKKTATVSVSSNVDARVSNLFGHYQQACKEGNTKTARACLEHIVNLFDDLTSEQKMSLISLEPRRQAVLSSSAYGLLYCLERRVGNPSAAEGDLAQLRYWRAKDEKLLGHTGAGVESLTGDQVMEMFKDIDKSVLLETPPTTSPATVAN